MPALRRLRVLLAVVPFAAALSGCWWPPTTNTCVDTNEPADNTEGVHIVNHAGYQTTTLTGCLGGPADVDVFTLSSTLNGFAGAICDSDGTVWMYQTTSGEPSGDHLCGSYDGYTGSYPNSGPFSQRFVVHGVEGSAPGTPYSITFVTLESYSPF